VPLLVAIVEKMVMRAVVGLGNGSVRTVSDSICVAMWRTASKDPGFVGKVLGSDW
jgi:hypothetical protein